MVALHNCIYLFFLTLIMSRLSTENIPCKQKYGTLAFPKKYLYHIPNGLIFALVSVLSELAVLFAISVHTQLSNVKFRKVRYIFVGTRVTGIIPLRSAKIYVKINAALVFLLGTLTEPGRNTVMGANPLS